MFGAGFVLGAVRVTLLVPRLGERAAELLEMPIMALVIWRSSRFVARRRTHELPPRASLGTGGVALALLVGAEQLLAATTRPDGIAGYLANRDPVSGTVYVAMLMWFAVLPWWMARRAACDPDGFAAPLDRRADRH